MRYPSVRSVVVGLILAAASLLAVSTLAASSTLASGPAAGTGVSAISGSYRPTTDVAVAEFNSSLMSVEVVLAPRNASQLSGLLTDRYNPSSANYGHWLAKGQFNALFAPSDAALAAVSSYLRAHGLVVGHSSSPFVVHASGSSTAISAAFGTSLRVYRNRKGITYFSNVSAVLLPTSLAQNVLGVVGLSNTVRAHSRIRLPANHWSAKGKQTASCETGYVTRDELFNRFNYGTPFAYGFGGGPGCNGLTPSQDNSIYGAPNVGARGKGLGVNLALFELSAYQQSDITAWARTFYGPAFRPPLVDIIVDGGPLSPICPSADSCPFANNGYAGDIEVDADIEMSLAVAPDAGHILVYNAPNDFTGQTELDEYTQIANDDLADVVSSSWGECEADETGAYVQAEDLVFEQMALQGQSMFASAGDTGPFDCIENVGTGAAVADTFINVDDPPSQPWVTSVGGTSLESANPGTNPNPPYPAGVETVWNVDRLCNTSSNEGGVPAGLAGYPLSGYFWCSFAGTGAGGGGSSQFWARPFFQSGPGITNSFTTYGNGTTHCSFAPVGTPCREVPDISANADEYTPYAEYCTGTQATPNSLCGTFSASQTPPGWFGIGGTSLSSPFLSAIFADRDSYQGSRSGNANQLLYLLYNINPDGYFHDITGIGQLTDNNGLFPTTPGYDLATGVGTPKMSAIITGVPQR